MPPVKAAPRRRPPAPSVPAPPWDAAHPRMKVPFALRLSEATHIKLTWLKQHLPDTSIQKIALAAIEEKVEQLLGEHYR